ncbi:MAG: hypothetical protein EA370_13300 [Wenzhouxiangella sp.]|nr:MAG: hypothetical protein EA370_13300 [Wenzhouxiangella sp.]
MVRNGVTVPGRTDTLRPCHGDGDCRRCHGNGKLPLSVCPVIAKVVMWIGSPFRFPGIAVKGVFALLRTVVLLPAR